MLNESICMTYGALYAVLLFLGILEWLAAQILSNPRRFLGRVPTQREIQFFEQAELFLGALFAAGMLGITLSFFVKTALHLCYKL